MKTGRRPGGEARKGEPYHPTSVTRMSIIDPTEEWSTGKY